MSKSECCTKKHIGGAILGIALLVVLIFGGKNFFEKKGVELGTKIAIIEVVNRTINACQPINLFVGEQSVDLVNIKCIEGKIAEALPEEAAPEAPEAEAKESAEVMEEATE